MQHFVVPDDDAGKRADVFLASQYPEYTRSALENIFDMDLIWAGEKPIKSSYRLKPAENISLDDGLLTKKPAKINLPVLYEDENVIVIDKPAGVLTHSKGALNLEPTVAGFIKDRLDDKQSSSNRAGIVHRLDRATSGVLITARNKDAQSKLQKQFSTRKVKKTYIAIVEGVPKAAEAIIDVPLERHPKKPQTFKAGYQGKSAVTAYRVMQVFEHHNQPYSLIELQPSTGRTHQLRVHMQYVGHPIVGDILYGHTPNQQMLLHSQSLEITIPGSIRKVFTSPLPAYFEEFIYG